MKLTYRFYRSCVVPDSRPLIDMKLPIPCITCAQEGKDLRIATVEFRDDGRYETTCPNGHTSIAVLQAQKFELLFDIGAYAIADGYYREAVSSFTSSLERFYEFFIKAVLFEKGLDVVVIDAGWKSVSKQSERQLGAFIILYTSELGETPTILPTKTVEFRNDVIHRGKIPSRQEALEYGQAILDLARPILKKVKDKYPKGVQQTIFEHVKQSRKEGDNKVGTIGIPTIISLSHGGRPEESLEKSIQDMQRWD